MAEETFTTEPTLFDQSQDEVNTQHTVQFGDTVASIAKKYGVSKESIISENEIEDPRALRIDQTLKIQSK